jgi:hypothetical protein
LAEPLPEDELRALFAERYPKLKAQFAAIPKTTGNPPELSEKRLLTGLENNMRVMDWVLKYQRRSSLNYDEPSLQGAVAGLSGVPLSTLMNPSDVWASPDARALNSLRKLASDPAISPSVIEAIKRSPRCSIQKKNANVTRLILRRRSPKHFSTILDSPFLRESSPENPRER